MNLKNLFSEVAAPFLARRVRDILSFVFSRFLKERGTELKGLAEKDNFKEEAKKLFEKFLDDELDWLLIKKSPWVYDLKEGKCPSRTKVEAKKRSKKERS